MCVAWEQRERLVAVGGGDGRTVRIWDAEVERRKADFGGSAEDAQTSYVTCLSFSPTNPFLLAAGYGDGCTRLFDTRAPAAGDRGRQAGGGGSAVQTFWEHERHERVLAVQMQDTGGYVGHMVSGSSDGKIKVVDPRGPAGRPTGGGGATAAPESLRFSFDLHSPAAGMVIHRRAFVAAAWTASQHVAVHHLLMQQEAGQPPQLNVIKHHEGLLGGYKMGAMGEGRKVNPFSHIHIPIVHALSGCLAFHPHLLKLATGTADGTVSIYNLRKT